MKRRKVRTICERQHRSIRMWTFSFAALVMLILTNTCDAHADTWQVAAGCESVSTYYTCDAPANISAVFTTELEPGTFYDGTYQVSFTGDAQVVMNIVGTFDGLPISFASPPPGLSDYSGYGWMNPTYPNGVCFGAEGNGYCVNMLFDDAFMSGPFAHQYEILAWNTEAITTPTSIPEPAEWILLLGGVDALLIAGWLKRRSVRLRASNSV